MILMENKKITRKKYEELHGHERFALCC